MCASVCPSEALWYGTVERVRREPARLAARATSCSAARRCSTKVYTVVDDLDRGPLDVLAGDDRHWLDDPFGLEEHRTLDERPRQNRRRRPTGLEARLPLRGRRRGGGHPPRVRPLPRARRRAPWRPATSGSPPGRSCARINTGEPRAIVALDDVAVGDTYLFRYPERPRPGHPAAPRPTTEVVAFSQKCTHLGCVVYYEPDEERWHCPCHEGNFDDATGAVISGPPTRPLGRIDRRDPRRRTRSGPSGAVE